MHVLQVAAQIVEGCSTNAAGFRQFSDAKVGIFPRVFVQRNLVNMLNVFEETLLALVSDFAVLAKILDITRGPMEEGVFRLFPDVLVHG